MVGVGRPDQLLPDQPGQLQQRGPGSVVGHDVLRLSGRVAGNQDDVADLVVPDPCAVVLQEAAGAVRTPDPVRRARPASALFRAAIVRLGTSLLSRPRCARQGRPALTT